MRKARAICLVMGPLLAACGQAEEPIIPELKGKWGAPNFLKAVEQKQAKAQPAAMRSSSAASKPEDLCRVAHVTFGKSAIRVHTLGFGFSLFDIASIKREGPRITLTTPQEGNDPASSVKIVLMLRNGEVRFDDVLDYRGRTLKYVRIPEGHRVQQYGASTFGEAVEMVLSAKPCPA
jgi:hypothetical protein